MSAKNEQVVILCGGEGTRLRQETEFKPKALVEIGGRPILWHLMRIYAHHGYRRFVLCLGYRGSMIKDYFVNYRWRDYDFTLDLKTGERRLHPDRGDESDVEDWEITFVETGATNQTGSRLSRARHHVDSETFLCNYCDGLSDIDIDSLVEFHHEKGKVATLTGFHPRSRFGVVRASDGIVEYFQEKPLMKEQTSGGFFVMNERVFDYLDDAADCVLETAPLERLATERELALFAHDGFWYSMDTYKEALALNAMWDRNEAPWRVWS